VNSRIARSFLLVGFLFAADKVVALVRQILVGRTFGIGSQLDAFNAANNLPDMLFALISGGAMAVAVIPVLTETLDRDGRTAAWALFSRLANWAFLLTAILAAGLGLFADEFIAHVVVPNFDAGHQALTASLMRLDLIALLIFSISGLVMASLQAHKHFLLPGLAPIFYNGGLIFGVLVIVPAFGIYGLAYGTILGAALHLAVQVPALARYEFRWTPSLDWRSPGVIKAATLMGPRILTVAAIQAIFVATDNFASGLGTGAITALAYGWLILQVPETVLGSALGTVLLPTLAELAGRGRIAEYRRTVLRAIAAILAMTGPILALGIPLMLPAVRLVFEGRAFTAEGSEMVAAAARIFLIGLPAHALIEIAVRAFYARQDARTPLGTAAATAALFITLCFLLTPRLGYLGVAASSTLAYSFEAVLLLALLGRRWMTEFPKAVSFTVTNLCNLACRMCGQWGPEGYMRLSRRSDRGARENRLEGELGLVDWKKLVDEVAEYGVKKVLLRGGEVFLYPDIVPLLDYIHGKGIFIAIDTNGTQIGRFAEDLVRIGDVHLTISVDGPEEIHDSVRGRKGCFEEIREGLERLAEEERKSGKRISKSINFTISPHSLRGLGSMPEVAESLGISTLCLVPCYYVPEATGKKYERELRENFGCEAFSWRGFHHEDSGVDADELAAQLRAYKSALGGMTDYPYMPMSEAEYRTWFGGATTPVGSVKCANVERLIDIQPGGEADFCVDFPDYSIGNVREHTIAELWNGPRAGKFRAYRRKKPLAVCARCGARHMAEIK
jgi:putative peptidoglycan lipid II flippase